MKVRWCFREKRGVLFRLQVDKKAALTRRLGMGLATSFAAVLLKNGKGARVGIETSCTLVRLHPSPPPDQVRGRLCTQGRVHYDFFKCLAGFVIAGKFSEPTFLPRQTISLDTVSRTELANGFRQVIAHGPMREIKLGCDIAC